MLTALAIRDVVLIERLSLTFGGGLSVLTGETGAGKSILLDALGLALGGRADSSLVRHGAEQASVTAEFALPDTHPAHAILREQELDSDTTLIVRRTLSPDGRSRAFVNDQSVGVTLLRRLGETLVEVHGQFDTQGLLNPQTHRDVLDEFGGLGAQAQAVAEAYKAWRDAEKARETAAADIARARQEEDYLRHAVEELDALSPQEGEEAHLAERRIIQMNAGKLIEALNAAYNEIAGERGADRALANAQRMLGRISDKAGAALDGALAALDRASAETAEAMSLLQALSSDMDMDPQGLEKVEERLFALRAAARKHSMDADKLPALRNDFASRLSLIEDQGDVLARLAREAAMAREAYAKTAQSLSEARQKIAGKLDKAVAAELAPLKMERARFHTLVEPLDENDWTASGMDRVAFTVATNPGAPPGPLNKIASGGELARFMLALKVVLARVGIVPTLVFDEVDTGIGGAVADAVGERLARLSKDLQVLVVTHSPQVAARGSHHLRVQKSTNGQKTTTEVIPLDSQARREEIARMLSGATITEQARAAAESLLTGTEGGLI